jgi:hypothetical protein
MSLLLMLISRGVGRNHRSTEGAGVCGSECVGSSRLRHDNIRVYPGGDETSGLTNRLLMSKNHQWTSRTAGFLRQFFSFVRW